MTGLTMKGLWAHKRRLVGMCTAVLLGVAFLAGTLVLTDTMRAGFGDVFEEANAGTDVVVRGTTTFGAEEFQQRQPIDASVVDDIRGIDGIVAAEPEIEGLGQIIGADGDALGGNGPPTLAGNWISDPELNPWTIAEGHAPEADGQVVIDRQSAEDGDLAVGDTTVVMTPAPVDVEVVGIATFGSSDTLGQSSFAAFTYDDAQTYLMGGRDQVVSVLARGDASLSQDELAARVAPTLDDRLEVITGSDLATEQLGDLESDFLNLFETFLLVFTIIALVVATFSIYNTFSVVGAQRARESALLRAIGASRGQVLRGTLLEAVVIGLGASLIGLAAGIGLATLMLGFFDSQYDLVLQATSLGTAVGVGVMVTVAAAAVPAIHASRVAPLAALRDVAVDTSGTSLVRTIVGTVITAAGGALVIIATQGESDAVLQQAGIGALLAILGMVVVGPIVARPASRVLGAPIAALRGVSGELAQNNAVRNPKRTAGTASALMVGVAVVTLFTVFGASLKAAMTESVRDRFGGDLVISTDTWSGPGLSPDLTKQLSELPEVDLATGIGVGAAQLDGHGHEFLVVDPPALQSLLDLGITAGSTDGMGDDAILVSDAMAEDEGWAAGDTIDVAFADGTTQTVTVAATFEAREILDDVLVPTELWAPHAAQYLDDTVLVTLADGVRLDEGRAAIEPVAEEFGATQVQDRDEFLESAAAEVDAALTVIYVLLAVSVLIALMGIANTLALSIHERTRELGLLRAVGQTRRQTRRMVRCESIVIALFGTAGGIGLGLFLAWGLVRAMEIAEGLGSYAVPVGQLAVIVGVGAVVGVLAAVRPARRAAKIDILQAIATE